MTKLRYLSLFVLSPLVFAFCLYAKTLGYGVSAEIVHGMGAEAAEIEGRLRPYFEQRVKNRREGNVRGAKIRQRPAVVRPRPSQKDYLALMKAWDSLSPEFRALYSEATSIPSGYDHYISPSGKFKIFYTTTGDDAVSAVDTVRYGVSGQPSTWRNRARESNGIPDYIDEAAFALDSAWMMIVERYGFGEPISAPDPGGSADRYNVLVAFMLDDEGAYYGETYPVSRQTSSRPGFSSVVTINSDWSDPYWWGDLGYDKRPYDAIRVTAAHEFMHAVQYAMVWTNHLDDLPYGFLEGTAVLMEETAFPEINDYLQYSGAYFSNPRISLFANYTNIYTNSILLKYIYERVNPNDSIGLIKAVHDNNYVQRSIPFHRNIEQASQKYAKKSWAEVLNGYHAESYFTGNRARRQAGLFVSDAEKMDTLRMPTANSSNPETKSVRPNSVDFFRYMPQSNHSDTIVLVLSGQRDAANDGKTWAASALVFEKDGSVRIDTVQLDQNGNGRVTIANWQEVSRCFLVTTNASQTLRRDITVTAYSGGDDPPPPDQPSGKPLSIYPNVIKLSDGSKPIRIVGGDITDIWVSTIDGKVLGRYNYWHESKSPAFKKDDEYVEWSPNMRIAPGLLIISATSVNPVTGKRSVKRSKVMIVP